MTSCSESPSSFLSQPVSQPVGLLFDQAVYRRLEELLKNSPDWLNELRVKAFEDYKAMGFPNRRQESWKTIPIQKLFREAPVFSREDLSQEVLNDVALLLPSVLTEKERAPGKAQLVFIDGHYSATLSSPVDENGVLISALSPLLSSTPDRLKDILMRASGNSPVDAMDALTQVLFGEGLVISIPERTDFLPLIEIVYVATQASITTLPETIHTVAHRQVITLGDKATARVSLQFTNLNSSSEAHSDVRQLELASRQVTLKPGASLNMSVLLNNNASAWQLQSTQSHLGHSSRFKALTVTTQGMVVRHAVDSMLMDKQAELSLNGLDILKGSSKAFHPTVTRHISGDTQSNQLYKGILSDSTESEFNGTVMVAKDANGTHAEQMNRSLLLSDMAKVWTRPQLQILAHDVKCTHGATVGQLEEDQLFYLASRGLDRDVAKGLLIYGFAEEVLNTVEYTSLRQYLEKTVNQALQPKKTSNQ